MDYSLRASGDLRVDNWSFFLSDPDELGVPERIPSPKIGKPFDTDQGIAVIRTEVESGYIGVEALVYPGEPAEAPIDPAKAGVSESEFTIVTDVGGLKFRDGDIAEDPDGLGVELVPRGPGRYHVRFWQDLAPTDRGPDGDIEERYTVAIWPTG